MCLLSGSPGRRAGGIPALEALGRAGPPAPPQGAGHASRHGEQYYDKPYLVSSIIQ